MRYLELAAGNESDVLAATATAIGTGEIVAFPTDTVYGMFCDPKRLDAIANIYASKGRSHDKPLILLVSSVAELLALADCGNRVAVAAAHAFLPGALTMVVNRPETIDASITAGRDTVGLRVPNHALLQALLAQVGPLASTSANVSGARAYDGREDAALPGVDLFVDAGPTVHGRESSVIDFTCDPPVMLREGAIAKATFDTWLGNLGVV